MKSEEEVVTRAMMKVVDLGTQISLYGVYSKVAFGALTNAMDVSLDEEGKSAFLNIYRLQKELQEKHGTEDAFLTSVQEGLKKRKLDGYLSISECATFVFAYSMLEGIVDDLLEVSKTLNKGYWESKINEKPITIGEIKNLGIDNIVDKKVKDIVSEFKGRFVTKKISALMEIAGHPSKGIPPKLSNYRLNLEYIGLINGERNKIIHEMTSFYRIPEVYEKIEYMRDTSLYMVTCIREKFGMTIHVPEMIDYLKNGRKSTVASEGSR